MILPTKEILKCFILDVYEIRELRKKGKNSQSTGVVEYTDLFSAEG